MSWLLDDDDARWTCLRIVQFTPPSSAASVTFGEGFTAAARREETAAHLYASLVERVSERLETGS